MQQAHGQVLQEMQRRLVGLLRRAQQLLQLVMLLHEPWPWVALAQAAGGRTLHKQETQFVTRELRHAVAVMQPNTPVCSCMLQLLYAAFHALHARLTLKQCLLLLPLWGASEIYNLRSRWQAFWLCFWQRGLLHWLSCRRLS